MSKPRCTICKNDMISSKLLAKDFNGNTIELNQSRICEECITEKKSRNLEYEYLGFKWRNLAMTIV